MRTHDAIIKFSEDTHKAIGNAFDRAGRKYPELTEEIKKLKYAYFERCNDARSDFSKEDYLQNLKNTGGFGVDYAELMKRSSKNLIYQANTELKDKLKSYHSERNEDITDIEIEHDLDLFDVEKDKFSDEEKVLQSTFMNDGRSLDEVYKEERSKQKEERAIVVRQIRLSREQVKEERQKIEESRMPRAQEKEATENEIQSTSKTSKISDEKKNAIDKKLTELMANFKENGGKILDREKSKDHTKE